MALTESEALAKELGFSERLRRERKEDREALEQVEWFEKLDKERSADRVDEVLSAWKDPLTGLPPAGMEGPRFRTEREREYIEWILSPEGARSRAVRYPMIASQAAADDWRNREAAR